MNETEEFKKKVDASVEGMQEALKGLGAFEGIVKSQIDLVVPLERKDVNVDGVAIFVSLTKDSRVVFNFPSASHAAAFFSRTNFNKPREPWYKRIFKK